MIKVKKEGILLEKRDLGFEADGVLNPAIIQYGGKIHMFYRAVGKGNCSTIGYCRLSDPMTVEYRKDTPLIVGQTDEESQGIEDPRIVKIDNTFYLTYTAYDGINALGSLMLSKDLVNFARFGVVVPKISFEEFKRLSGAKNLINEKYLRYNKHEGIREIGGKPVYVWDKNVVFFPRKINGKFCFLHRIRPDIQIASVSNLGELNSSYWQKYFLKLDQHIILTPKHNHEVSYIGGGCPPIETADGWILIYHSVCDTLEGYVYSASAALMDLNRPQIEIARLDHPLFVPDQLWELKGEVNNVCFPTGAIVIGDKLYIYYGAADEHIACASLSINELLKELKNKKHAEI